MTVTPAPIAPLYAATVGGQPLRFFRTPLGDGRPDFPWCGLDDLGRCLGLNRTGWAWADGWVRTGAGRVSIAPGIYDLRASSAFLARKLGKMDRDQWIEGHSAQHSAGPWRG